MNKKVQFVPLSTHRLSRAERVLLPFILILGGVGLVIGWQVFWFLTDDAYIAFRYISNAHFDYGYVWNPPPFQPVEGYTSFLWIVLLDLIWRSTGIDPTGTANYLSLGFCFGTMLLGVALIMRILRYGQLRNARSVLIALFLSFLVLNRTFLAWSSSGLETAMMDFLLLLWIYIMLGNLPSPLRACLGAFTAICLALTRPDGLLFCAATGIAVLQWVLTGPERSAKRRILLCGLLPFCIIVIHEVWRVSFYGEWLPNTYYAKIIGTWPQSGVRYLVSFILEYALWFPGLFICRVLIRDAVKCIRSRSACRISKRTAPPLVTTSSRDDSPFIIVGTLLLHAAYYTYVVGGDHFEYRVYAHLVPLVMVALIWSLNRLHMGPRAAIAGAATFLILSMPVQWSHWALTKDLLTRKETHIMRVPIAPHWPKPARYYARLFDQIQSWLIEHHVCMRHQEHKVFWLTQLNHNPPRETGLRIPYNDFPVIAARCVGVLSWVLPRVAVIDELGLNDYVIARSEPTIKGEGRLMAHSRHPPRGYIDSYRPNVVIQNQQIILFKRHQPVTSDYIIANERRWRNSLMTFKQSAWEGLPMNLSMDCNLMDGVGPR